MATLAEGSLLDLLCGIVVVAMSVEKILYNKIEIDLLLDMAVGIGGDKWPAADLFCQLCTSDQWKQWFQQLFDGRRCIELGSGTGFVCNRHLY
jgi:hypothetical protein